MTYVQDKCCEIFCLFLKSILYHGYLMKSDLVATCCSFRHSRDQDVDSDISWTLSSLSVEVKHAHLCMPCVAPQGSSCNFSGVRHPCCFQDSLLRAMLTSHRQLKYSMTQLLSLSSVPFTYVKCVRCKDRHKCLNE